MAAKSRTTRTSRQLPRFALSRGNVVVALVTTAVTIGALSFGLRGSRLTGATDPGQATPGQAITQPSPSPSYPRGSSPKPGAPASPTTPPTGSTTTSQTPVVRAGAGAVSELTARSGPGKIVLSWRLAGESPAQLRTTIVGSDGSHPGSSCTPTATGCTISGLANGVEYTVTVSSGPGAKASDRQTVRGIPYPAILTARTTRLWFDAADPGSLLTAGPATTGATVRHILDRSPAGADAGPVDGYLPPTIAAINGHAALKFGSQAGLAFPAASLPTGSAPSTVYVVASMDSATPQTDCFAHLLLWGTQVRNGHRALIKGCGTSLAFADTFDTWREAGPTLSWRSGQTQVMRGDFTAGTLAVWMGGASSYVWSQPSGSQMATGTRADGMLGSSPWGTGGGWTGRIGEVIVLSAIPSATENTAIMQYLQRKWGV